MTDESAPGTDLSGMRDSVGNEYDPLAADVQLVTYDGDDIVIKFGFIAGIGLYKLSMGIHDGDSEQVAAALQVMLGDGVIE